MAEKKYYHGGVCGLKIGDWILPPSITGTDRTLVHYVDAATMGDEHVRPDKVYVTTALRAARAFAGCLPNGTLYEVEPEGELEIDPDCAPISFMCDRAKVIRIVQPLVRFKDRSVIGWMNELKLAK